MTARRRGKFGVRKRTKYLENLREGMRRGAAAQDVGISRETARLAYNAEPEFAAAVEQAEMDANEEIEDALREAALSGNVTAAQVWLYNRVPDRWMDKRNVQVTGPGGGAVRLETRYAELSDQEIEARIVELENIRTASEMGAVGGMAAAEDGETPGDSS